MKIKKSYLAAMIVAASLTAGSTLALAKGEQGSTNGKPFQTLQAKIDLLTIDLADAMALLQGQIDTLVAENAAQDDLIAAIQSAIATLEERVTENEADIETLQAIQDLQGQLIATLETNLTDLEARVAANEDDITYLIRADQIQQHLIASINRQIRTINLRISANDGDISILQNRVSYLLSRVSSLQYQLSTKQNRINGYCAAGSSIRQIDPYGRVTCERDDVSAGVGRLSTYFSYGTVHIPASFWAIQYGDYTRYCSGGYRATGGGYYITGNLGVGHVKASSPYATGWRAIARSESNTHSARLTTYVTCARVVQ